MRNRQYNREQSEAALSEFGFIAVPTSEVGSPTPGKIADRISDILTKHHNGNEEEALAELKRLLFALDSYDGFMMEKMRP